MRSYRAARREALGEPVEFEVAWQVDGDDKQTVFVCKGEVTALMLSELVYSSDVDTASPEGMAILRQVFAQAFGDETEFRRFFRVAVEAKLGDEQLLEILSGLLEDFTGRPTRPSAGSPPTPSTNGESSKDVSLLAGGYQVGAEPLTVEVADEEYAALVAAAFSA